MASSYISRLAIGSIIIAVVLFFFLTNFDILFIFLLLALISYEFLYLKIINKFILFFFIFLTTISILFVPYKLFENIFILQLISLFCIFLFGRYKKELFVISIYFFSIILFYLISTDRNFFYLLFLISFLNDTIAYISGKSLRGPLIIPKISPNKTWSGTSISFFFTTFLLILMNFNIFISMLVSILLFIGDIFFSYIKRYLNIKDFSPLLGSHGGVLDRLDSIFLISIFFHIYLFYLA